MTLAANQRSPRQAAHQQSKECNKFAEMIANREKESYLLTEGCNLDDEKPLDMGYESNCSRCENETPFSGVNKEKSPSASMYSTVRTFQRGISSRFSKRISNSNSVKIAAAPPCIDTADLMMNVIRSPIGLGHFLAYCESEFNSEYLQLFVAVEKFRTKDDDEAVYIISDKSDGDETRESWRQIDDTVARFGCQAQTLSLDESRTFEMMSIWNDFFNDQDAAMAAIEAVDDVRNKRRRSSFMSGNLPLSPNYVFLPKTVSSNTLRRMEYLDLYGADVFSEAVTTALKVLHRDIFPRFIKSRTYLNMMKRRLSPNLDTVVSLPAEHLLVVKPPKSEILAELGQRIIHADGKLYNLKEILRDGLLFNEFLLRLKKTGASEYLLCPRIITIFRETIRASKRNVNITAEEVQDQAWNIYLFFVAEGSSYEIPLNGEQRKAIQLSLGKPTIDMFYELEAVAMNGLVLLFNKFKFTENYKNLAARALHTAKNILKIEAGTVRSRRSSRDHLQSILTRMNIR